MIGVRVTTKDAQKVKLKLKEMQALHTGKKTKRDGGFVIFPVKRAVEGFDTIETEFDDFRGHRKFRDVLGEHLSKEELALAKRAFDTVGDIAIIEVPPELEAKEKLIAEALCVAHKNIRAVYKKTSDIKGEERTREHRFLYGKEGTKTLHKEHGMMLRLDIDRAYFSPRLSAERERILSLTKDGEVVIDMFAGIGPFSILLAKNRDVKTYAIDVNQHAFEHLKENIRINKVADKVKPLLGDAREVAPRGIATRVIMNLPKSSDEFMGSAFDLIKEGTIHYYAISGEEDLYDSKINSIKKVAEEKGREIEVLGRKIVRPYSPRNYHIVIDVGVK